MQAVSPHLSLLLAQALTCLESCHLKILYMPAITPNCSVSGVDQAVKMMQHLQSA